MQQNTSGAALAAPFPSAVVVFRPRFRDRNPSRNLPFQEEFCKESFLTKLAAVVVFRGEITHETTVGNLPSQEAA